MKAKFRPNHCEFHIPFRSPVILKLITSLLRFYQSLNDLMEGKTNKKQNNNKNNNKNKIARKLNKLKCQPATDTVSHPGRQGW